MSEIIKNIITSLRGKIHPPITVTHHDGKNYELNISGDDLIKIIKNQHKQSTGVCSNE
jgi:hypothetical protein